jgi:hypothetical protein
MEPKFLGADPRGRPRAQQPLTYQERVDDVPIELVRTTGRAEAVTVKPLCDLLGRRTGSAQLDHSVAKRTIVAELLIFHNGASKIVSALRSPGPADRHIDPFGFSPDGHGDPLHQAADDRLPLLDRGVSPSP